MARLSGLTPEQEASVKAALSPPFNETMLVENFNIPITRRLMRCLEPEAWLNDEIINFYMCLLQERDGALCASANMKGETRLANYFFNIFFMSKLLEKNVYSNLNSKRLGYTYVSFAF